MDPKHRLKYLIILDHRRILISPLFPRPNANDGAAAVNKRGVCVGNGLLVFVKKGEVVPSLVSYHPEVNFETAQGLADIRAKIGATVSLLFDIDID